LRWQAPPRILVRQGAPNGTCGLRRRLHWRRDYGTVYPPGFAGSRAVIAGIVRQPDVVPGAVVMLGSPRLSSAGCATRIDESPDDRAPVLLRFALSGFGLLERR
ncbi:MAG: hypothetical protein ACR2H3_07550, partial [Acidimicrobiales bacterium]